MALKSKKHFSDDLTRKVRLIVLTEMDDIMKKYEGYLFVYFTGESEDGEQIYFAVSSDGLHWNDLNDGKPVLRSHVGEKGVRDPLLCGNPGTL